ncbi:hypothetical protein [Streptomyces niveus]|uniref:hypothetical protein n=1 Tax=Streptomyces niveus TaxID=193462 RepID=UPI003448B51E
MLGEGRSGCPGDARDDAVLAVEVADLDLGAEGGVVELEVVAGREHVLDVAVLDAVGEGVGEQESFRGQEALVGEVLDLGDSGRGAVDEDGRLEVGADEGNEGRDVRGAASRQDPPALVKVSTARFFEKVADQREVRVVAGPFDQEIVAADEEALGDVVAESRLQREERVVSDGQDLVGDDGACIRAAVFDDPYTVKAGCFDHER